MRFSSLALCLFLGALVACRSSDSQADAPVSFSRAFETYESRRGTASSKNLEGTLIDYDSEIIVQPDRARLAVIAGRSNDGRASDEIIMLQAQLTDVSYIEAVLTAIAEYEEESRSFFTNDFAEGLVLQDDARWRSFTEKQLDIVKRLKDLVYTYVNQTEYDGQWNWRATELTEIGIAEADVRTALDHVDAIYHRLSPTADSYEPAAVTKLVNDLTDIFGSQLASLERVILLESPKATLEMEAALLRGKERLPVSISPYTAVEGDRRGRKSHRVGIPSPENADRVQKEYEAYGDLSDSINELIEMAGDDEMMKELRGGVLNALETLAENLGKGLEAKLNELIKMGELATVHADAQEVVDELRAIRGKIDKLGHNARTSDPVTLTNNALSVLATIREGDLLKKFNALSNGIKGLPNTISVAARDLALSVEHLVRAEADQLAAALRDEPAAGAVAKLYGALKKLSTLAELRSFGDLKPGKIKRRPFAIDQAPNGVVNLASTPAESGDVLEVSYKMTISSAAANAGGATPADDNTRVSSQDEELQEYQGANFHDVRKFGFYSTYSAQVLFFDRLSDGSPSFRAAPGVSYNLHYRPEGAQRFHDLVGPASGLGVWAPSFETGTELAVGMQLTLFNDMIQGGYGYNISVSSDPWMFYFALDLIGAFQAGN